MKNFEAILVILVILVGILIMVIYWAVDNLKERKKRRQNSRISLKESVDLAGIPIATFICGDNKLNFLLDTGSSISFINKEIINLIPHEKIHATSTVTGLGDSMESEHCKVKLQYKNMTFEDTFGVIDLSSAFNSVKKESGINLHGILGVSFFEKYKYILDFDELVFYR